MVLWSGRLSLAAGLVSAAWVSDVVDGRVARVSGGDGNMGPWDLLADTAVGTGIVVGLGGAGALPVWYAVAAVVSFGVWSRRRENFGGSMILQLLGYVPLLSILWMERPDWWWLPFVTAVLIGVVDWRRLIQVNIPGFVRSFTHNRSRAA